MRVKSFFLFPAEALRRRGEYPTTNTEYPISKGEKPLELSQYRLAKEIGVPPRRINEIILGKRGVTADTALRLGHYLGTTPDVWMNLQTRYELDSKRLALSKLIACLPRFAAAMA